MNRETLQRIVPFVVLTVVFAALLYRAEHKAETGISRVDRHITEVTSPCLRYGPRSRQCKRSFEAAVATINHDEACAVLRKAGLHVLSCRGARLAREQRRTEEPTAATPATSSGGDANSAPTGSSQPGRHDGGSGGGRATEVGSGGGGHKSSPEKLPPTGGDGGGETTVPPAGSPSAPPSESSSGASSSSTTERITETTVEHGAPEAPVRSGLTEVVGGVGHVVEEPGATVNEVVGGVTESTCSPAKVLCP